MTMPMTHLAAVDGKKMDGVAKYPLDAWIEAGAPEFATEKWAMICILLAERGIGATQSSGFSMEDKDKRTVNCIISYSNSVGEQFLI